MDMVSRLFAEKLRTHLSQTVVVENKVGASGNIATEMVSRSAPDGYTLLMGTNATHTINPYLFKRVPYDPVKDFQPVSLLVSAANVVAVPSGSPVRNLGDLIDLARKRPGRLDYVSAGYGATGQLAMEQIKALAGVSIVHIPFRGIAPAIQEVLAGRSDVLAFPPPALMPHIASGALRPIAVISGKRIAQLPQVPTVAEQGLGGFEGVAWFGLMLPSGAPAHVLARLQEASRAFVEDGAIRQMAGGLGPDHPPPRRPGLCRLHGAGRGPLATGHPVLGCHGGVSQSSTQRANLRSTGPSAASAMQPSMAWRLITGWSMGGRATDW